MGVVQNQTGRKIPVIDFSSETMKPGSTRWDSIAEDVRMALEEYGCFLAVYDKVPSCQPFFHSLKELFNVPVETKLSNNSDVPYFGYIGEQPRSPLFESFGINDGCSFTQVSNFANRMLPNGANHHSRDLIVSYARQVSELDKMVTRMLFERYGVKDNSWEDHIKANVYNLRMNKYRAPKPEETSVGLVSHTDMSFIGINQQSQVNGLEVCFKDGTWVSVEFPPNAFIILAGDAMMAWSNGKIRPCLHRVTMTGEERYSSGLFSYHTGTVKVPQVFINEKNPRKFKDFEHLGLLTFGFTHPDIPEQERISAYSGVN